MAGPRGSVVPSSTKSSLLVRGPGRGGVERRGEISLPPPLDYRVRAGSGRRCFHPQELQSARRVCTSFLHWSQNKRSRLSYISACVRPFNSSDSSYLTYLICAPMVKGARPCCALLPCCLSILVQISVCLLKSLSAFPESILRNETADQYDRKGPDYYDRQDRKK